MAYRDKELGRKDTPVRKNLTQPSFLHRQTAGEMDVIGNNEVSQFFHTAETANFLRHLLDVSDADIASVKVKLQETFGANINILTNFAADCGDVEAKYYNVFVDAANAVLSLSDSKCVHSYWISRPDDVPKTTDEEAALIRPDAAAVLGDQRPFFRLDSIMKQSGVPDAVKRRTLIDCTLEYANAHLEYYWARNISEQDLKADKKLRKKERQRQKLISSVSSLRSRFEQAGGNVTLLADLDAELHKVLVQCKMYASGDVRRTQKDDRGQQLRRTFELLDAVYQALTEKRTGTVPQAQSENESEEAQEHEHEYEQDEAMQDQQDQAGRQQEQRQHHDTSKEENPEKTRLDPSTFDRTDLEKLTNVWWLRVTTPVEIKPAQTGEKERENSTKGSAQLLRYMKQVLRTQLDRRFVFGLLLCGHQLRVFYDDRSSLVATEGWIDIRTSHDEFIRIILALSSLDHERLGWDRTMKLRLQTCGDRFEFAYSTDPRVRIDDYGSSVFVTQWAIFVPFFDGSSEGEWYLTIVPLSLSSAEVLVGRATLVWRVKLLNEDLSTIASHVLRVLKQAWNRTFFPTEAKLLDDLKSDNVGRITRSVRIGDPTFIPTSSSSSSGTPDCQYTQALRRGIISKPQAWHNGVYVPPLPGPTKRARSELETDSRAHERGLAQEKQASKIVIVSRIQTRTLMETFGWPIKYFKDLRELITCLRDAIQGHRDLYFQCLVLHRDISVGNILISPINNDIDRTRGVLIDFDHAKKAKRRLRVPRLPSQVTQPRRDLLLVSLTDADADADTDADDADTDNSTTTFSVLGENLITALLLRFSRVQWSSRAFGIMHVLLTSPESSLFLGKNIEQAQVEKEMETLLHYPTKEHRERWLSSDSTQHLPPSWVDKNMKSGDGSRTGTMAFMSYEILSGHQYNGEDGVIRTDIHRGEPVHSVIQDIESFFWVLVYLCLTRKGPGGARRDEFSPHFRALDSSDSYGASRLRGVVSALFDSEDMDEIINSKMELFKTSREFEDIIQKFFHPYFNRVKELLKKWWNLLKITYNVYDEVAQGTLHDMVLDLLDAELQDANYWTGQEEEDAKPLTLAEIERRGRALMAHSSESTMAASEGVFLVPSDPTSPERLRVSGSVLGQPAPQSAIAPQDALHESPTAKKPRLGDNAPTQQLMPDRNEDDTPIHELQLPRFPSFQLDGAHPPSSGPSDAFGPYS